MTTPDARAAENFIPWSQLESLIRPGMTSDDLVRAVMACVGLAYDRYTLISVEDVDETLPAIDLLRFGVRIVPQAEADKMRNVGDEVLR